MEQEIKIQGYLECNGSIIKIMSLDDVKNFVLNYGKAVNEITEDELDKLACVKWDGENEYKDDLGVCYISNPHVLYKFRFSKSGVYKVEDGTVAVAKEAVSYKINGNKKWTDIDYLRLADTVLIIGTAAFCINKTAQNVNGLGHIDLSSSLIKIGDRAFENCRRLNEIIFPETLKYIGVKAFSGCDFSSVVIPSGVKRIGSCVFSDNEKLKSVIFKGTPEIMGSGIFDNCPIEEIKIPKGSIDYFEKELYPISKDKFIEE